MDNYNNNYQQDYNQGYNQGYDPGYGGYPPQQTPPQKSIKGLKIMTTRSAPRTTRSRST